MGPLGDAFPAAQQAQPPLEGGGFAQQQQLQQRVSPNNARSPPPMSSLPTVRLRACSHSGVWVSQVIHLPG